MGNNLDRSSSAPKPYRDIGSRKPSSPTRGEGSKSRSPSSALSSSLPLSPASPPPFALSSSGSYSSSFERSSIPSREGSITLEPLPTSAPPSFQSHSPFAALPANILSRIFSLLSAFDLLQCTLVSKVRTRATIAAASSEERMGPRGTRNGWCWRPWMNGGRSWR